MRRSASWARMMPTGSRPLANSSAPCPLRGAVCRAARPIAARSAAVTHGRGVHVSEREVAGAQAACSSAGVAIAVFLIRRPLEADRVVVIPGL